MNRALADKLGLRDGDSVRVRQGGGDAVVAYVWTTNCPRIACGSPPRAQKPRRLGAASR